MMRGGVFFKGTPIDKGNKVGIFTLRKVRITKRGEKKEEGHRFHRQVLNADAVGSSEW